MTSSIRKPWARALEVLAVTGAYYAAGKLGLIIPFTNANVSPVWPAAGLALGSILVFGWRTCLGIAIGAFLVNLFTTASPWAALGIAAGNTLGPALTAALLKRRSFTSIKRLSDVFDLLFCGALGLMVTALIGPTVLFLNGVHAWHDLPLAWLIWWLGDCMGVLLVTPLIVNAAQFKTFKLRWMELALLVSALLGGSALLLLYQTRISAEVFDFALLPFVIWGAARFGVTGAGLTSCALTSVALWDTARGIGPFVAFGPALYNAGGLIVFITVLSVSGLSLAALLAERTTAQEALSREEKLRRTQEQYQMIVETTNDGVWLLDSENRTAFVNSRLREMMGYAEAEMIGRSAFDFFFPEDIPSKIKHLQKQRNEKEEPFYDRLRRKDGSELWVLISANPVFGHNGQLLGILGMLSDVTVLRKTEESLIRNEKLIAAGRLAATISHEVNNPLEAVINLIYLSKSEAMSKQGEAYLKLAEKELQRVSAITRRTLGFFRETSAQSEFSLPELLDETIAFYEQQFTARGIHVVRDYRCQGTVRARRGEIQQVFSNLASNALDAMNDGGALTVRVSEASKDRVPGVQVQVGDTGRGIAAPDLDRVFEPFFTTKQDTGTGLGLWVSKEIIHKHGGIISATSTTGNNGSSGTQFIIFLPKSPVRDAAA
ncbi:MAG TPA: MASE1 domain-containing protein [Candidatus Angelobacter sp.]|nr:MASE1 domain-containing protein [Candidatus Angelobacter sp.]